MQVQITLCPGCQGYHNESLETPPVMENFITAAGVDDGMAVSMPCVFTCPETGEPYQIEVAFYRPYTRIRALDRRAWPYAEELVHFLSDEELEVIEHQSRGALGSARWACDTA